MRTCQVVLRERCAPVTVFARRRRFLLGATATGELGNVRLARVVRLAVACGLLMALSAPPARAQTPRPTNDADARGKETGAARPEAAQLVTGSPVHLQSVVAGTPPTAILAVTPVNPPPGLVCAGGKCESGSRAGLACVNSNSTDCPPMPAYPAGTTIVGNTLSTEFSAGFRAWFNVQLSNWDPNGDDVPPLRVFQAKVDCVGDGSTKGFMNGKGAPLQNPVIACTNDAAGNQLCRTAFGEAWAKCAFGTCKPGYLETTGTKRTADNWCFPDTCVGDTNTTSCNTSFFGVFNGPFRFDEHKVYYGGTLIIDIPGKDPGPAAKGKYCVNLNPDETFLADNGAPPLDIETAQENGFCIDIKQGACCHNSGTASAGCFNDSLRNECETPANAPFLWTAGADCANPPTADGCAAACCLPGGSCEMRLPEDCSAGGGVLTTACLGDGDASGRDDACEGFIPAGTDCWKTVCGRTQVSFYDNPIPAGFFDPSSEPFAGQIRLGGASGPGEADTRVRRLAAMLLDGPPETIPIELVQLNLVSCDPVDVVTTSGHNTFYNVSIENSADDPRPPFGSMTVTKTHPNGGTFEAQFFVQPRFVFSEVSNPDNIRVLDTGQVGRPPVLLRTLGSSSWVHRLEAGCTALVCGENFVPGVEEDPGTQTQCCRKVGHAGPGHLHETAPPDCSCCPTVSGGCCDPSTGVCSVVAGALNCSDPSDYKGDGTDCRDTDGDGLADVVEGKFSAASPGDRCNVATDPLNPDTDGDGCSDGGEVAAGTDPRDPCDPAGGCPGVEDCDNNGVADRCELPGNDCDGDGMLDRCPPGPTGACCNTQDPTRLGCAELTKAACDSLSPLGWVFQGYCTRCPTQNVGHNVHDGVAVVHFPTPVPECSHTGVVAAVEDCAGRQCLYDTWITDPNDPTCHTFAGTGPAPAIPAGFFGPGSDPFVGQVCFQGVPLGPTPFGDYGDADTIICRSADPFDRCALPSLTESAVPIQIVALSLLSRQPIVVTYNGGQNPELWIVAVALSDVPSPLGTLTAVKTHCNGGTYTSILPVQPKFTFANVVDPNVRKTLDTGTIGGWPVFTLVQDPVPPAEDAPWIHDPQAELSVVMDPCTHFHPGIEETVQVPSCDCNGNLQRDKCDLEGGSPDCNRNGIPDSCELSGNDCNANGIPDECEPDCNGNGRADGCDVPPNCATNCSADCNANGMPDECEPDCNGNGVPDACDILVFQTSTDCTGNGRPDECDLGAAATADCQRNQRPDLCDLAIGVSADINADGVPDECGFARPQPPLRFPLDTDSTRALGMVVPSSATASGPATLAALRVTMVELQKPVPSNAWQFPPQDFGSYESATCTAAGESGGCARWVGKPGTFLEVQVPASGPYLAARLQCSPYYGDWASGEVFYVMGAEIVPSSAYVVETFAASCQGHESTCTAVSAPRPMTTGRYGDIAARFNPPDPSTQPDAIDITQLVNKFKNVVGAPEKAATQLQPNLPELNADLNALDIVAVVDAVKGLAYPFAGPCPCPSPATCGAFTCGPTVCTWANICVGGSNNGADCTPPLPPGICTGGGVCTLSTQLGLGPGAMCVKTCQSPATNSGEPCINNAHCPGGTCGSGFCRDKCGRCTP